MILFTFRDFLNANLMVIEIASTNVFEKEQTLI